MLTQNIYEISTFCFIYCSLLSPLEARIAVSIATDYGVDGQDSDPSWTTDFAFPQNPGLFCGPPSVLSNAYRGLLPWG
jgi:hypothetical protein